MAVQTVYEAAHKGDFDFVRNKLEETPSLLTDADSNKRLLIHWAALGGNFKLVSHLIELGTPIDPLDDTDTTPLILASSAGHIEISNLLISKGANINQQTTNGHSALQYAASKGWLQDNVEEVLFGGSGSWTGKEQLQLLDAVELYGFGNWQLVSKHVETRTAKECKEEYIARYLEGNIGKATWSVLANHKPKLVDHIADDTGPLSPAAMSKLPPIECNMFEARLLGYRPHRDDYEREYNMQAESIVARLKFECEKQKHVLAVLKLALVDIYTRHLRERARRKRIVRDHQLVAKFFFNLRRDPTEKQLLSKPQRDLRDGAKFLAQYLSSSEHAQLIENIDRERELRHRLADLLRYRSLGLKTQEEIIHYEQHSAYEILVKRMSKNRRSYGARNKLYQNQAPSQLGMFNVKAPKKRKKGGKFKFQPRKVHLAAKRKKFMAIQAQQMQTLFVDPVTTTSN